MITALICLYGVGILLCLMLTGRGPFDHISRDSGVFAAHALEEPKALSSLTTNPIPPELDAIVLKVLSEHPEHPSKLAYVLGLI
jgi:hypothetical protein